MVTASTQRPYRELAAIKMVAVEVRSLIAVEMVAVSGRSSTKTVAASTPKKHSLLDCSSLKNSRSSVAVA